MIYMIINKTNDKRYIGQTTQNLKQRFQQHWYARTREQYKGDMYVDMRETKLTDWEYFELEDFDNEAEAIGFFNTEVPNGYNRRGGSKQVVVREERYRQQPIRCNNGMVFKNAMEAARWLFNEEGKGKTEISCKTNLLMHLKGKTKTCYGYMFEIVEDSQENAAENGDLQ